MLVFYLDELYDIFLVVLQKSSQIQAPPPNMIEKAEKFGEITGHLDENNIKKINEWLVEEGGALIGSHIILEDALSAVIDSLNEGLNPENDEDIAFEDLQLDGDGWLVNTALWKQRNIEHGSFNIVFNQRN